MLPFAKVWGQLGYEPLIFNCTILKYQDRNPMTALLTLGFGVPMLIITFCYVSIYWKVKKTAANLLELMDGSVKNSALERQLREREAKMTKTTLLGEFLSQNRFRNEC